MSFHKVSVVTGLTAQRILSVKDSMTAEKTFLYLGLYMALSQGLGGLVVSSRSGSRSARYELAGPAVRTTV
jgi:hypothetical protein